MTRAQGAGCRDGFQWRPREERRHESKAEGRGMLLTKPFDWEEHVFPSTMVHDRPALLLLLMVTGRVMDDETARSSLAQARSNHAHRIYTANPLLLPFISLPHFPRSNSFSSSSPTSSLRLTLKSLYQTIWLNSSPTPSNTSPASIPGWPSEPRLSRASTTDLPRPPLG